MLTSRPPEIERARMTAVAVSQHAPPSQRQRSHPTLPSPASGSRSGPESSSTGPSLASRPARGGPTRAQPSNLSAQARSATMINLNAASAQHENPAPGARASTAANVRPRAASQDENSSTEVDDTRPSSAPGNKQGRNRKGSTVFNNAVSNQSEDESRRRRPNLARSRTDYHGPRDNVVVTDLAEIEAPDWTARHGFEDHYQSEDIIFQLANSWYMYFTDKRHETTGQPKSPGYIIEDWRMRDRLKTVSAALAVCLNIGVEPPDQLKTNPGAKLEAWVDPYGPKVLDAIGKALQAQYENISLRVRYKQYMDPSVEETKKLCISLRRNAKDERVLFHYNGHGVPKPTASGEIWVFNRNFTQYIPISLYDLQQWLQAPVIFVWDCSEAGNILTNYHRFIDKHEEEEEAAAAADPSYEKTNFRNYLHLAACDVKENLPTNPQLPADLFTACLTTPIEMALWFFVLQNPLKTNLTPERAKKLPGRLQERKTPLGELHWIFTAITDTIAWTSLPRDLFRLFFRQDLMVAALYRNFILAQRVMKRYGCNPQSYPVLPDTHHHPLWESWDLAVDLALAQLPMLERKESEQIDYEYKSSTFFTEQLTAFEVYLARGDANMKKPPEQLPIVLQVLLSQQHRVRALIQLGKFLDLGPWAVELALSIGIFPYVLKLLQSAATELKPIMVFLWTRILAVDISCQPDLIKDSGYNYFASILKPSESLPVVDNDEHKAMCSFILAMLCKGYKPGQLVCNQTDILLYCLTYLNNENNVLLRQWACLCISQLWQDLPEAKWRGIRENAPLKLSALTKDQSCEVRAAVVFAMTTFLGIPDLTTEVARIEESIAWTLLDMTNDGSPLVRKELLVFFSRFVLRYESKLLVAAYEQLAEEKEYLLHPPKEDGSEDRMGLHYTRAENRNPDGSVKPTIQGLSYNTVFAACWKHILILNVDPHPEVQKNASIIVDYVHQALLNSSMGSYAQTLMDEIQRRVRKAHTHKKQSSVSRNSLISFSHANNPVALEPSPGLLKRTASLLFQGFWANEGQPPSTPPSPNQNRLSTHKLRSAADWPAPPEQNDLSAGPGTYHVVAEPVTGGFQHRDLSDEPKLPLKSTFLDWSIEYFREPQMKPSESEEPGSTDYNERLWRRLRNENVLRETQPQKEHAGTHKWTTPLSVMNNGSQPTRMTFHQFEDHLAVADNGNTVQIWDWSKQQRIGRFSNGNPEGSKVSDMKFINEDDTAFLMTGSSDGVLRIYRNYESEGSTELAAAWRALTHMVPSNVNSGMVFDWQQVTGKVLVAGDVRVIRVWAAASETCITDIPARSGSCVTSLTSDQMTGNIFVAGFGDGAVRVFDTRCKPQEAMVKKWKDDSDRQWIRSVHMQRGGQRELLSASRNGRVKLWDIRLDQPLKVFQTTRDTLRTASTHEHLPVFSIGTSAHTVKVFNFDGKELSRIEPYSSFLQQSRGAPISTTSFHPHRMMLGCAAKGDHHINIFTCSSDKPDGYQNMA